MLCANTLTNTNEFILFERKHTRKAGQGRADDNMKRREFLSVLRFRDCASKERNEPPSTTAASNLKLGAVDEGRDRFNAACAQWRSVLSAGINSTRVENRERERS